MPATISEIRDGIIAWARQHGLLLESIPFDPHAEGNPELCPFSDNSITYFRLRYRIVRATTHGKTLAIYTRLKISEPKKAELQKEFDAEYEDEGYRLTIQVSRSYKVDQKLDPSGENPIRYFQTGNRRFFTCGSSIGLGNQRNAGTFGALVKHKDHPDTLFGLSCNHVIGGCCTARPGTPVVIPGIQDVTPEKNSITIIGKHDSTGKMSQGLPSIIDVSENCDLAYFALDDPTAISSYQGDGEFVYDTPTRIRKPALQLRVKKWGRSTGLTKGTITAVNTEPEGVDYNVVSYPSPTSSETFKGTVYFRNLLEISSSGGSGPFSSGGDSGSLVVTDDGSAVIGIVIAGSSDKSLVLPLGADLRRNGLSLVSGHNT